MRRTMANIRTVAVAIEAYIADHDETCPAGNVVSDDHKHYRIVRAGADNNLNRTACASYRRRRMPDAKYRDRLEDDLIHAGHVSSASGADEAEFAEVTPPPSAFGHPLPARAGDGTSPGAGRR